MVLSSDADSSEPDEAGGSMESIDSRPPEAEGLCGEVLACLDWITGKWVPAVGSRMSQTKLKGLQEECAKMRKLVRREFVERSQLEAKVEERKKVVKDTVEMWADKFAELGELLVKKERESRRELLAEVKSLAGKVVEGAVDKVREVQSVPGAAGRSYADALGGNVERGWKTVVRRKVRKVRVTKEGVDPKEVRELVKKSVKPGEDNVKVCGIAVTGAGVIVELEGQGDVERMVELDKVKKSGMRIVEVGMVRPSMVVFDVDRDVGNDGDKLLREIWRRNFEGADGGEESFGEWKGKLEVLRKYPGRDRNVMVNVILRVEGGLYREIMDRGSLYVGWRRCGVKEYVDVVRCLKCQRYGHVVKYCKSKVEVCSRCGEEHKTADCKSGDVWGCSNCKNSSKDWGHSAGWTGCPAFMAAVRRYVEQIDYG